MDRTSRHPDRRPRRRPARRQQGVVMIFALIALVVMLIGAAALVRSSTASLTTAANLGFKRDLTNQAERAVDTALTALRSGTLAAEATRQAHLKNSNYSATLLATNAQGVPTALLNDTTFNGIGVSGNDISVADQGVTLRYVIDRMCVNTGAADETHCTMSDNGQSSGCSSNPCDDLSDAVPKQAVYRLSIRVTGPRGTQAFFQSTLTL